MGDMQAPVTDDIEEWHGRRRRLDLPTAASRRRPDRDSAAVPALALLALACAIPLTVGAAGPSAYVWKNVKVGGGGFAPALVYSRAERGLAYLRTDMGGAYRWDATASRWIALQDRLAESSYFGIESLAAHP